MRRKNEKNRNFIILISFATVFSLLLGVSLKVTDNSEVASAAELSSTVKVSSISLGANNTDGVSLEEYLASNGRLYEDGAGDTDLEEEDEEILIDETEDSFGFDYVVTKFDTQMLMYASDTVNVRAGAGTEYDRLGKVAWGTQITVTGVTDNGWYEVLFKDMFGYIRGDYVVSEMPGIPYLFVGDSRTVQLEMAIGSTDKAYIAKVGEGYSYFKNVALSQIQQYAGSGTKMIINFGVNDLSNASKYIALVNSYIDVWENAGVTVYYSAVTPVGSSASVTNAQIEAFNAKLQEGLDSRVHWIDSYSYLSQTGFDSSDGLHYSKSTYKNLYSYYMSVLNQQ